MQICLDKRLWCMNCAVDKHLCDLSKNSLWRVNAVDMQLCDVSRQAVVVYELCSR